MITLYSSVEPLSIPDHYMDSTPFRIGPAFQM